MKDRSRAEKVRKWSRLSATFVLAVQVLITGAPVTVQAQQQTSAQTDTLEEALTKEQADRIICFIIEKISSGALDSEEAVRGAISEGEEKFQITLTEEEKSNIVHIVNTVNSWEFDADELAKKAKDLYEEYGTELLENPEQVVKSAAKDGVKGFFEGVGDFFVNVGKEVAGFFKEGVEKLFSSWG